MHGVPHRPRRADRHKLHGAVHPLADEVEPPRALPAPLKRCADGPAQALDNGGEGLRRSQRLDEGQPLADEGAGWHWLQRLEDRAEGIVQLAHQPVTEAPRQRSARGGRELPDAGKPHPVQRRHGFRRQPQRGDGQGRQRLHGTSRWHHDERPVAVPSESPGGARRIGNRHAGREAAACQTVPQIGQHRGLAALQVIGARAVDADAVRRIGGRQRRIALAPAGEIAQIRGVACWIGVDHGQARPHGLRLGPRQPGT